MKRSLYRIGYSAAMSERQALRVIARMRIMDSVSAIRMRAIAAAELFPEETRQ